MNEDEGRMTDEQAEYLIAAEAAINAGKATVNELADAEEAGEQVSIRELLERMGDASGAEILTPERIEEKKNAHEIMMQPFKEWAASEGYSSLQELLDELRRRSEAWQPFQHLVIDNYPDDHPLMESPVWSVTVGIEYYFELHDLDEATQEERAKHLPGFLVFFANYLQALETVKGPLESMGPDITEDELLQVWEALEKAGIIPRRTAVQRIKRIYPQELSAPPATELIMGYARLLQGPLSNAAARARLTPASTVSLDRTTGEARKAVGKYTITLDNFSELTRGLNDTAHMLLDALIMQFTASPPRNGIIELPLRDYMEMRGLKNEKEARKQIKDGLEALRNCKITGPKGYGKNKGEYLNITLYGGAGVYGIRNSIITFSIGGVFQAALMGYMPMFFHVDLLKIDTSRYKHAYGMGRYIYEQKYINAGKPREDLIKIKSLLAACPNLPAYEDLDKSKGEITRKIIDPFMNNMNHLEDIGLLTWKLCHNQGQPLTPDEEEAYRDGGLTYAIFEDLYIKVDLKEYPSQARRIEAREKHKAARKKAAEAAQKKKLKLLAEKEAGL